MTHISSYAQALAFAVLFLVFINGGIGWALVYTIVGAAAASVLSLVFSRRGFSVSVGEIIGTAQCGERVPFEVTIEKTGFCFIPFLYVNAANVNEGQEICLRTSLLFRKRAVLCGELVPRECGLNTIAVESVVIKDFLGLARFKREIGITASAAVLPRIIEYDGPEIAVNMLPSEREDTDSGTAAFIGGTLGYEHRDYAEGDSPRRINYKLSAKRGRLMVRKDEYGGCSSTQLFMSGGAQPVCCEKAFALARGLVMCGAAVTVTHGGGGVTANSPETLALMREWLAFQSFSDGEPSGGDVIPSEANVVFSGGGDISVIT